MSSPAEPSAWNHSEQAEQSVLGALLIDNSAFDQIADILRIEDFYFEDHRRIFRVILSILEKQRPADLLTVSEALAHDGKDKPLEFGYLGSLAQNTPSSANIRRYAEIVRERAILRSLFMAASAIAESVTASRGIEAKELLDQAQARLMAIGETHMPGRENFHELRHIILEVAEFVDSQHEKYQAGTISEVTGVPSGFIDLDRKTTGFQGGELIIIAARPGMGKTSLVLNIAEYAALKTGKTGLIFSMEMTYRQLALRILAGGSGINVQRLISGRVYESEWPRVSKAISDAQAISLLINEAATLTIMELRALARRAHREYGGLSAIYIDYIQLMDTEDRQANRAAQISVISRGLKSLAKELDVPVIALSQLNRELEKRPNKRPVLSDLRDSGSIEQDADLVLFIYREEMYRPDTEDKGMAEIIIGKQRNGPTGYCQLTFRADQTRFLNYTKNESKEAS